MTRPSTVSSAHLVRYSWARWIGFRVVVEGRRQGEVVVGLDASAESPRTGFEYGGDAGMGGVVGAEEGDHVGVGLGAVELGLDDAPHERAFGVAQVDRGGALDALRRLVVERRRDRERPELAGGHPHALDDRAMVGLAGEGVERRVGAPRQEAEVGAVARCELDLGHQKTVFTTLQSTIPEESDQILRKSRSSHRQ